MQNRNQQNSKAQQSKLIRQQQAQNGSNDQIPSQNSQPEAQFQQPEYQIEEHISDQNESDSLMDGQQFDQIGYSDQNSQQHNVFDDLFNIGTTQPTKFSGGVAMIQDELSNNVKRRANFTAPMIFKKLHADNANQQRPQAEQTASTKSKKATKNDSKGQQKIQMANYPCIQQQNYTLMPPGFKEIDSYSNLSSACTLFIQRMKRKQHWMGQQLPFYTPVICYKNGFYVEPSHVHPVPVEKFQIDIPEVNLQRDLLLQGKFSVYLQKIYGLQNHLLNGTCPQYACKLYLSPALWQCPFFIQALCQKKIGSHECHSFMYPQKYGHVSTQSKMPTFMTCFSKVGIVCGKADLYKTSIMNYISSILSQINIFSESQIDSFLSKNIGNEFFHHISYYDDETFNSSEYSFEGAVKSKGTSVTKNTKYDRYFNKHTHEAEHNISTNKCIIDYTLEQVSKQHLTDFSADSIENSIEPIIKRLNILCLCSQQYTQADSSDMIKSYFMRLNLLQAHFRLVEQDAQFVNKAVTGIQSLENTFNDLTSFLQMIHSNVDVWVRYQKAYLHIYWGHALHSNVGDYLKSESFLKSISSEAYTHDRILLRMFYLNGQCNTLNGQCNSCKQTHEEQPQREHFVSMFLVYQEIIYVQHKVGKMKGLQAYLANLIELFKSIPHALCYFGNLAKHLDTQFNKLKPQAMKNGFHEFKQINNFEFRYLLLYCHQKQIYMPLQHVIDLKYCSNKIDNLIFQNQCHVSERFEQIGAMVKVMDFYLERNPAKQVAFTFNQAMFIQELFTLHFNNETKPSFIGTKSIEQYYSQMNRANAVDQADFDLLLNTKMFQEEISAKEFEQYKRNLVYYTKILREVIGWAGQKMVFKANEKFRSLSSKYNHIVYVLERINLQEADGLDKSLQMNNIVRGVVILRHLVTHLQYNNATLPFIRFINKTIESIQCIAPHLFDLKYSLPAIQGQYLSISEHKQPKSDDNKTDQKKDRRLKLKSENLEQQSFVQYEAQVLKQRLEAIKELACLPSIADEQESTDFYTYLVKRQLPKIKQKRVTIKYMIYYYLCCLYTKEASSKMLPDNEHTDNAFLKYMSRIDILTFLSQILVDYFCCETGHENLLSLIQVIIVSFHGHNVIDQELFSQYKQPPPSQYVNLKDLQSRLKQCENKYKYLNAKILTDEVFDPNLNQQQMMHSDELFERISNVSLIFFFKNISQTQEDKLGEWYYEKCQQFIINYYEDKCEVICKK